MIISRGSSRKGVSSMASQLWNTGWRVCPCDLESRQHSNVENCDFSWVHHKWETEASPVYDDFSKLELWASLFNLEHSNFNEKKKKRKRGKNMALRGGRPFRFEFRKWKYPCYLSYFSQGSILRRFGQFLNEKASAISPRWLAFIQSPRRERRKNLANF